MSQWSDATMTRGPSFATRIAVLMVFLQNGNQALSVRRLTSKVKEVRLQKFTKSSESEAKEVDPLIPADSTSTSTWSPRGHDVPKVDPSIPAVSSACRELCTNGLLETIMARPARSHKKKETPHYRLPVGDVQKIRKTVEFLVVNLGPQLANSTYGQGFAPYVGLGRLLGVLDAYGIKLKKEEEESIARMIADSPEALRRALDLRIMISLLRLSGGKEDRQAIVDALCGYLAAARTLDIADGNNRKDKTSMEEH